VALPTGSGKTLIAAMLIRKSRSETSKPLAEGGRRTVFLVPTIILAQQQGEYLRRHTDMKVEEYYGSKEVEWNGQRLS
jgi:endoribonuclease Dicer